MKQGLFHPGGWGVFCSVLLSNGRDHHTTDDHNHLAPWKAHGRILDPELANEKSPWRSARSTPLPGIPAG
jgi:hypothetical protein